VQSVQAPLYASNALLTNSCSMNKELARPVLILLKTAYHVPPQQYALYAIIITMSMTITLALPVLFNALIVILRCNALLVYPKTITLTALIAFYVRISSQIVCNAMEFNVLNV